MDTQDATESTAERFQTAARKPERVETPNFKASVIEKYRRDGYWIETFHFATEDPVPGLIVSGLVSGIIEFLDNPIAASNHEVGADINTSTKDAGNGDLDQEWHRYEIKQYKTPVACVAADIRGNGLMDLIVCHDYGPHMLDVELDGGNISWLQNPGRKDLGNRPWEERFIGRWPGMHRFKVGRFTQKSFLEIVAASVVRGPHDKITPIPIIRFQAPEKILDATEWPREIIDDKHFTIIHELTVKKFHGPDGLDSMLVSSREGTTWLYYANGQWNRELITIGEPKEVRQSYTAEKPSSGDHWGTGNADAGKVGTDPFAYIVTFDPFHGTTLCVYTKEDRGLNNQRWKRHTLDVFGTPTQRMKWGDGPGHFVVCADFDGDGDDEILISLFGSLDRDKDNKALPPKAGDNPNKGIMYYKVLDLDRGIFGRWRVANESSARIALGNFANSGSMDFASVKYNVKNYYEEPDPQVVLHVNQNKQDKGPVKAQGAVASVWDNEGIVYIRKPNLNAQLLVPTLVPLIEVADYSLRLEVYPKGHAFTVPKGHGIKVLYGSIAMVADGKVIGTRSPFSVDPFTRSSTMTGHQSGIASETMGAVILRIEPIDGQKDKLYRTVADIPVSTKLDVSELGVSLTPLVFKQASTLWWGKDDPFYKDVELYELSGFHVRFLDPKVPLVHIRFWAAGTRVNAGVHNHAGDIFSEIHVALSPGTKTGGMAVLKKNGKANPPKDYNQLPDEDFKHITLRRLDEHGSMWERDSYGQPVRDEKNAVKYRWHKWQAGSGPDMDVWMAIEFNPDVDVTGDRGSGIDTNGSAVAEELGSDPGKNEAADSSN